ncbi:MAG: sigma-54-dependent Fis family transcriptional regulator, partial [Sphingomonadaceae bacterium]|nr:sigma-54-dependent Fis family transcriptional regulator [Sphingomonadaceae bacterium]
VPVTIPPLRARRGDIAALARHFVRRLGAEEGVSARDLSDDALALLEAYDWPGNVRQLQNALFRAAVLCDGARLTALDFPQLAGVAAPKRTAQPAPARAAPSDLSAEVSLFGDDGKLRRLEDLEAEIIRKAIHHCRGRMSEVARRLGIGRSTLYRKLGEMAVTDDVDRDDDVRNVA